RCCEKVLLRTPAIHLGRIKLERDRRAPLDDFKRAERLLTGAEIRMAPGRGLGGFGKREAQTPRTRERRPVEEVRHSRPAVKSVCSSTKQSLLPNGSLQ